MANHIIVILRSDPDPVDPSNSRLTLSDNGETVVNLGDVVTWIIDKDCHNISSIFIQDEKRGPGVFDPDPLPVMGTSHWSGVINPNGITKSKKSKKNKKGDYKEESYTIYWSEDGEIYSFDPIIRVNPPK